MEFLNQNAWVVPVIAASAIVTIASALMIGLAAVMVLRGLKKKSVDEIAEEVMEGKWGNDKERKMLLTAAGYDYEEVRKKVNKLVEQRDAAAAQ